MMQALLFTPRTDRNTFRDEVIDGHTVVRSIGNTTTQVVVTRRRDNNGKTDWCVFTRTTSPNRHTWLYSDGLEFRHQHDLANQEMNRRARILGVTDDPR